MVECSTEKPDAILTRVRVPGAATDLSPGVNFPGNVDSRTVSAHPLCAVARINIGAHVKSPKHWQPYQCLDTRKYMAALLMRMMRRTQVRRAECPTGTMKYSMFSRLCAYHTHTHTHTHTLTRTHARTPPHARTHARTHTRISGQWD